MANIRIHRITATVPTGMVAWLCACALLFSCLAHAAPLVVDGQGQSYALAPHIDFLEDTSGALTISEVSRTDGEFRPAPRSGNNEINFGY